MNKVLRYSEMVLLPTFKERFEYLKLSGVVGEDTFGFDRYANQVFYRSPEWKRVRRDIIIRDGGWDLGVEGHPLGNAYIIVHHMNPISIEDIEERNPDILNPEFLICVSATTHRAIHYGIDETFQSIPVERKPGDTCPWR